MKDRAAVRVLLLALILPAVLGAAALNALADAQTALARQAEALAASSPQAAASLEASRKMSDYGPDGPYLLPGGANWRVRGIAADGATTAARVAKTGSITVAAAAGLPSFRVQLRPVPTAPAPAMLQLHSDARLLVVADTHGEYPILAAFLQRQGVIGAKLKWTFGKGQLVVTGDMFDRGAHQTEILWLLYKLEDEAKAAGGAVHVLLGNHEAMVLRGDLRYLHPRYPPAASLLGMPDYAALFGSETLLGAWLRSRPAVLKLGDLLLLHGGISPAVLDANLGVADLNAGIAASLAVPASQSRSLDARTALIVGPEGPQWYRGYFGKGASQTSIAEVDRTLAAYGVSRILVGHTVVERVTPLYDGKVVAVQVYPRWDETNGAPVLEGALREKGRWYRVTASGESNPLAERGTAKGDGRAGLGESTSLLRKPNALPILGALRSDQGRHATYPRTPISAQAE